MGLTAKCTPAANKFLQTRCREFVLRCGSVEFCCGHFFHVEGSDAFDVFRGGRARPKDVKACICAIFDGLHLTDERAKSVALQVLLVEPGAPSLAFSSLPGPWSNSSVRGETKSLPRRRHVLAATRWPAAGGWGEGVGGGDARQCGAARGGMYRCADEYILGFTVVPEPSSDYLPSAAHSAQHARRMGEPLKFA